MSAKDYLSRVVITAKDETAAVFSSLQKRVAGVALAIASFFSARLFGGSVEQAEKLDVQMRKLRATIAATGGAAGLTAEEIDQMARRLDEATLGSAEGFRDAANALLTFKSIGSDSFETVLSLAADLEAAGFGTLEQNAVQLGKALEDPVRGLTALRRSGVSFTAEQEEVIKSLVKTGRAAEAQGIILDAVAGQVGGVAAAAGGGLSGLRDLTTKLFTDIQELFGGQLLPALTRFQERVVSVLRTLRDSGAIERLGSAFGYVIDRADKLVTILTVAIGVRAIASLRAFTATLGVSTAAVGTKAIAVGALTLAMNVLAAAGARATAALFALTRATPLLALGTAVAWLAGRFFASGKAAEDTKDAVEEMGEETVKQVTEAAKSAEVLRFALSEVRGEFQRITGEGKSVGDALKSIVSGADISSSDGIAGLLNDLDELRRSALATGQEIQTALVERLSKMSAKDLRDFGIQAEMAFGRGELAAEGFAAAMTARVSAAAKQLGVDLDSSLSTGVSKAFAGALDSLDIVIGSFDQLKAAGVDAGSVLERSIAAAVDKASSPQELEKLVEVVQRLGKEGRIAEAAVTEMLDAIKRKSDDVTPGINSVAEALQALGIISDVELQKTADRFDEAYKAVVQMGGSLREQREAFQRYATAAIAANNGVATAAIKTRAAMLGIAIDSTDAGDKVVTGMSAAEQKMRDLETAAKGARAAVASVGDAAADSAKEFEKFLSWKNRGPDDFWDNPDAGSAFFTGQRIGGFSNVGQSIKQAANAAGGRR